MAMSLNVEHTQTEESSVNVGDLIELLEESRREHIALIDSLKNSITRLESIIDKFVHMEDVDIITLTSEEIRNIVLKEVSEMDKGACIYPSDIAFKHNLSVDDVERVLDKLVSKGILK